MALVGESRSLNTFHVSLKKSAYLVLQAIAWRRTYSQRSAKPKTKPFVRYHVKLTLAPIPSPCDIEPASLAITLNPSTAYKIHQALDAIAG